MTMRVIGLAILALLAGVLAMAMAVHHPLSPAVATGLTAVVAVSSAAWPTRWPLWALGAMPVAGLMVWTGWLVVEEMDLLLLACTAGCAARLGWDAVRQRVGTPRRRVAEPANGPGALRVTAVCLLWLVYLATLSFSVQRGIDAGGGWAALAATPVEAWWWHGYREPLNALRVAKPFVWLAAMLPLWLLLMRERDDRAGQALAAVESGMVLQMALVGLLTLWERLAYTDLTDFSSDYRTAALFWEMHVGGAALDASLAASLPFVVHRLLREQRLLPWLAAAVALALGAHAAVSTFSRILFVALPAAALVTALLVRRQGGGASSPVRKTQHLGWMLVWALAGGGGALLIFGTSGWRGLLAWWGVLGVAMLTLHQARRQPWPLHAAALAIGLCLALMAVALAAALPKGAYLGYAGVMAIAAALAAAAWAGRTPAAPGLQACTLAGAAGLVLVARHWGGDAAAKAAVLPALAAIAVALLAPWCGDAVRRTATSLRAIVLPVVLAGVAMFLVGAFHGGAYIGGRLGDSRADAAGRLLHWSNSLALLHGTGDAVLGKGSGRYVAEHVFTGITEDVTGDLRWVPGPGEPHLWLSSGRYSISWGDMLRVSQRVGEPGARPQARLRVRSAAPAVLHAEICEKNLLYNGACLIGKAGIGGPAGAEAVPGWQELTVDFKGGVPTRGAWYAPRLIVFSLALESSASQIEIASVELRDSAGRPMLSNGDFRRGLAHWAMSSDRHHLPWHAKNMALHLRFEQGWLGLGLFALLHAAALWNLLLGSGRSHAMAPALMGSLVGLLVVGMVDSLLDIPRLAWVHGLVLLISMLLPRGAGAGPPAAEPGRAS